MNGVAQIGIYILGAMFVVGSIGSLLVVLLTFVEDVEVWFKRDEKGGTEPPECHPMAARSDVDFSSTPQAH